MDVKDEDLLAEVEDLMRSMPDPTTLNRETEENCSWIGRLSAVIEAWDLGKTPELHTAIVSSRSVHTSRSKSGSMRLRTLLYQAHNDLRMKTVGPISTAIGKGEVFDYFDEIRKIIEGATNEIYFIDPYLDAEFVSKYLVHVKPGVSIRMLTRKHLKTLLPAVQAFSDQHGTQVLVRSCNELHDRYMIVDGNTCYQSGASFHQGAKKSPTTVTQITDAFPAIHQTYEELWEKAKIERE